MTSPVFISLLPTASTPSPTDLFLIAQGPTGATRSISLSALAAALNTFSSQTYSLQVPTTGFVITIGNTVKTLILAPTGTLASGKVILPAAPVDGQIAAITSTQTIIALTVAASPGQGVVGAPTTLTVSTTGPYCYEFEYVAPNATWYRRQ
jgi:hypothetical protein